MRRRFADLITRQLDLFLEEEADLIVQCQEALDRYNAAGREEAEEMYGDYLEVVDSGTEILADIRDRYAQTLDEPSAEIYAAEFNGVVARRLPRFALEIENR